MNNKTLPLVGTGTEPEPKILEPNRTGTENFGTEPNRNRKFWNRSAPTPDFLDDEKCQQVTCAGGSEGKSGGRRFITQPQKDTSPRKQIQDQDSDQEKVVVVYV